MLKKNYFSLFLVFIFVGFASCSKKNDGIDNGPCGTVWTVQLEKEFTDWITAAQAYGADETPANCKAYRASMQAYINALEPFGDCAALTGVERAEWKESMDSARESIKELDCD